MRRRASVRTSSALAFWASLPAVATCVGQREQPLALGLLAGDQALVLEHLQGRVDRAGARPPDPAGAVGELLDHLVAMHGTLAEQRQDRGAHVAAPGPATTVVSPARAERRPAVAERSLPGTEGGLPATGPGAARPPEHERWTHLVITSSFRSTDRPRWTCQTNDISECIEMQRLMSLPGRLGVCHGGLRHSALY